MKGSNHGCGCLSVRGCRIVERLAASLNDFAKSLAANFPPSLAVDESIQPESGLGRWVWLAIYVSLTRWQLFHWVQITRNQGGSILEDNETVVEHVLQLLTQLSMSFYAIIEVMVEHGSAQIFSHSYLYCRNHENMGRGFLVLWDTTRYDEVLGFDGIRPEAKHLHEAHFFIPNFEGFSGGLASFSAPSTFYSSASALLAFWIMARNSKAYSEIDITISYLLLGGAVVLDIYSVICDASL
uniref:Uncharacterized protein n=1 Tax=Populus alba TaxID=43335 RepID=A0A4U5M9G6_POPAL|nr:hypothetical protein D5086_0000319110 [Populus alba]